MSSVLSGPLEMRYGSAANKNYRRLTFFSRVICVCKRGMKKNNESHEVKPALHLQL